MDDLDPVDNEPVLEADIVAPKPWGFWATIGLSLVAMVGYFVAQIAVTIGYVALYEVLYPRTDLEVMLGGLGTNGLFLSVATWSTLPINLGFVLLLVKLRRGWTIAEYLALEPAPIGTMIGWLGITLALVAATDGATHLLGRPIVPEFMHKAYQTAYCVPLLWATLIVAAPLWEESFFRGFMFRGIVQSPLGATGAILITSACWALMHLQYDFFGIAQIFLGGILLGVVRLRTQSLYPVLAMHSLMNLIATVEAVLTQAPDGPPLFK